MLKSIVQVDMILGKVGMGNPIMKPNLILQER